MIAKRFLNDDCFGEIVWPDSANKHFQLIKTINISRIYVVRPHRKDILVAEKFRNEIRFSVEGLPKKYIRDTVTLFKGIADAAKIDIEFAVMANKFVVHNHVTNDISVVTSITLPYNPEPVFTPIPAPTFEQMAVLL